MRKILLVQKDEYRDRALQDVDSLIAFEQQHIGKNDQVDLLAVIVGPLSILSQLAARDQTCGHFASSDGEPTLTSDSVSVNGVWQLLTLSQMDASGPITRQESLSRVLNVLSERQDVQRVSSIFPAFSSDDDEQSVAEQMAHLRRQHPGLSIILPLSIQCREYAFTAGKVVLRS